ncbi:class I SAM-dependent methyltransferase [Thiocapsa roseopersicina]|uniref:Methyltransferase domain-containing protein n=1 Tax=Thiocapsa roseopersicina TaxID=1058 RepID=A0A1H2QBX5_THIRO|nr:methyltransferase domain-containing protein [Thiocapsa roseopersicina]SDW04164.1 Methyltransferase domain-containing protein [Thiocapsa roseopersicina]
MPVTCRFCGSNQLIDLGPCAPVVKCQINLSFSDQNPGRLYRCTRCHFGQRSPHLEDTVLAAAYRATSAEEMDYSLVENAAWRLGRSFLTFEGNEVRHICDVGCHAGAFLNRLPSRWKRFGIESAVEPRRHASEIHGVTLIGERIEAVPCRWQHAFDAVTMFDVFEHLVHPFEQLAQVATWLRPGGRLLLSTGDMDAWSWRLAGGNYWYLQTLLHLSFGSRSFFQQIHRLLPLRLVAMYRIPHQDASPQVKLDQLFEFGYWECRQRGGFYRLPQRLIQSLPRYRGLMHRQGPPWTMAMKDHVLVIFESF